MLWLAVTFPHSNILIKCQKIKPDILDFIWSLKYYKQGRNQGLKITEVHLGELVEICITMHQPRSDKFSSYLIGYIYD